MLNKDLQKRLKAIDKIREDLKKAEKTASKEIVDLLKGLMVDNPLIRAIKWQQYTPAFNDGEPCTFTLDGPMLKFDERVTGEGEDSFESESGDNFFHMDYEINDDFFEERKDVLNYKEIDALKKAVKDVNEVFGHLFAMDDQLEEMFGSGIEVIVTADGIETEEYDCGH